jgi:hypothetical protein
MKIQKLMATLIVCVMIAGSLPMMVGVVSADTGSRDNDNDFAHATVITSNDITVHGDLTGNGDDLDFYKIQLNNSGTSPGNAEKLEVNATSDGPNQVIKLNIYDPSEYWIMTDLTLGKTSYLTLIAPTSGWFYVAIEGQGTIFPYGLRFQKTTVPWNGDLHNNPATAVVVSSFPYTNTGSFANQSDPQDFYKIHLEKVAGDHTDLMMVKLTPPTGGPLVVPEVYWASNNTGVPNWFNQKGSGFVSAPMGNIFTFAPKITADYLVRIWGYQGTGNYDLKIKKVTSTVDTNTDKASAQSVLVGAKKHEDKGIMAEVAYGMDSFDYFKFTGKEGMHINATLYSVDYDPDMMLPVLYLHLINDSDYEYAEAEMIVLRQTADPHAVIEGILPHNDTYYIGIESQGGAGQYVLNITANTPPQVIAPLKDEMFIWENGTNSSLTLSTVFADFDGDTMTYSSDTNTHMDVTINPTTSVVTFAPKPSFKGIACINLTATDSEGDSGTYKVCPNTHGINHAPYIKKQFNQTFTDGILIMKVNDVVANITLANYFGDPDALDHHWYNFTGYDSDNVWISVGEETPVTPDHYQTGLLTILGKGHEATEHVTFCAKDNGYPKLASCALNLTIMLITGEVKMWNKNGGEIKINEDNVTTFPVKDYIYFKPPAPKDDTIAYTFEAPANIEVTMNAGIATLTPAKDWCGSGVIKFTGTGVKNTKATNTTAVKLTVACINDPPVITDWTPKANLTLAEGGTMQFKVVATDVDTAVNLIRYKWIVDGVQMSSVISSFNYTPNYEMAGIHNVTVFVNDSQVQVSYKWANVTVTNVNRVPTPGTVKINEPKANTTFTKGKAVTFQAATATDPDKDTPTYSWYDNGVKIGETQSITYKFTKKGAHEVKLVVTDGKGGSTESIVKVNVKEPAKKTPGFDGVAMLLGVIVAACIVAILGRRYNK